MIILSAARDHKTTMRIAIMTEADRDALPTRPQAFDPSLGASPWWREGETIVRRTGRWGPYEEHETRHIVLEAQERSP